MARTLAAAGKWREAVGLFRRAEKRVIETLAKTEEISPEQREELNSLQLEITAAESDAHAHAVLEAEVRKNNYLSFRNEKNHFCCFEKHKL